mmetsp:Transcript_10185/g.16716  ORF Transcript_10185/g.16716 Transcript_10185/m.16716 type:complete len:87 (-) Transcript_10185:488-748(-)|eukprot:CAMPEP_0174965368 /NCGR_PEP_ID=MMETSP0004_2-20121128/6397_1 /TAXON_ID=420556 /ORGANISM="Ochromonas sp., Strain CCMP1393" /LENGTH=86 /DNA_ID=CAMNT_0016214197 /DNA_START=71 /DNA_END=331 /DNA_ORIENTATION=+
MGIGWGAGGEGLLRVVAYYSLKQLHTYCWSSSLVPSLVLWRHLSASSSLPLHKLMAAVKGERSIVESHDEALVTQLADTKISSIGA